MLRRTVSAHGVEGLNIAANGPECGHMRGQRMLAFAAMPEEGIETQELKENLDEAAEQAERAPARWTIWLSLSTAILAVLAAIASLQSGSWANDAIVSKNDAVLHQSKADDAWSHYEAMGIKAVVYATQAEGAPSPELTTKWKAEAERERAGQKDARAEAEKEDEVVKQRDEASEHSLHLHHKFATSVTIFQVSIALAAIAALTRRKSMWWVSLAAGAVGAVQFVVGWLHA